MVSVEDVAKHAGVGRSTVSRVVNGNGSVSEAAKQSVLKAINDLGYVPNEMARSFKNRKSNIIALMVPTINHPFFSKLTERIEQICYDKGYKLLLVNSQGNKNKETEIIEMIKKRQVDGIIFVTHHIHENIGDGLPIITIDRHLGNNIPYITSDNYGGATMALNHLLSKGCKKIGFIGGKTLVESEVTKRLDAYLDFVKANNMERTVFYEILTMVTKWMLPKPFYPNIQMLTGCFARLMFWLIVLMIMRS